MSEILHRRVGGISVPAIGLGCMCLSHAYASAPPEAEGIALLRKAYDLGYRHFDTATLYGFGANERLVGKALNGIRQSVYLASKGGMAGVDGKRVIDGRPETLLKQIDASLERLQTDHIDLYYLHRWDRNVPIMESVGALATAVEAGKIGAIGLSEVSASTIAEASKEAPIAAVQNEYSVWTRNCEIGVSDYCVENGIALVAFSPVCRGFLAINWDEFDGFGKGDIRAGMPRFQERHRPRNQDWLSTLKDAALSENLTTSQLALAWLIAKGSHVLPIPGTTNLHHLEENFGAQERGLSEETVAAIDALMQPEKISGFRYPPATQLEIDTEQFGFERASWW